MISNRWIATRRPHWEQLEVLVKKAGLGLGRLTHQELQQLGLLYRQTASDLAVVQQDSSSPQLAAYLNQLLIRNHNLIYSGSKAEAHGFRHFFLQSYPRVFRETLPMTALATAIFLLSGIAGWAVTLHDAGFAHRLLGPQMMETIERKQMWTHSIVAMKPVAASTITTNNLSVAFATIASGITGIGTVWMMALNGLLIGVVGAATWNAGMAMQLWSFVAPHGVLELPAIFLAGGAGLEIGRGLLFPGRLRRRTSVAQAGGRAAKLAMGVIPLLLVAGAIEGFFSPSEAPLAMKFILAAVLFSALVAYLFGTRFKHSGNGLE